MKFSIQDKIIITLIRRISVTFKVFIHHVIGNVTCAPSSVSYRPKMSDVVSLTKLRKCFLEPSRTPALQSVNQITDRLRRQVLHMDMHMIFAHHTIQNPHHLRCTDLTNQILTSLLYVTFQNVVEILGYPDNVHRQPRYCMTTSSLLLNHNVKLLKCLPTESHLKKSYFLL